jgi:hypothetical protein
MDIRCRIGWYAQLASIFLLAGLAALLLQYPIAAMPLWLEQPNEGWNAIHAMHAFGPQLYPPRDSFIINNYPPLWFYLTGALAKNFGDPIFPGRVLAFLAFNVTAVAIFVALRALDTTITAACIGALTFIVILAGLLGMYVGLSEPQMMAHAFCTSGVALALGAKTRAKIMVGAAMVVTGFLFKHTVVALPIALTVWMFQNRRPLFSTWLNTTVLLSIVAGAMMIGGYGRNFIDNVLFPRVLTWSRLGTNLALISKVAVPIAGYSAVAWRLRGNRDSGLAFAGFAILSGVATLIVFGSAVGVSINCVFDLVIASAIGLGIAWDRLGAMTAGAARTWRTVLIFALIARVLLGTPRDSFAIIYDTSVKRHLHEQSDALKAVRDDLKSLSDPIVCEPLALCVWAGHASAADLWKLRHEVTLGPFMDTGGLLARIAAGEFRAIVTFSDLSSSAGDLRLPGLYDALGRCCARPVKHQSPVKIFYRQNP